MPKAILEKLPKKAQSIYESAYADGLKRFDGDESRAARYAIGAVKQAGFRKNEETGQWQKMSEFCIIFGEPIVGGEWIEAACTGTFADMNGNVVSITEEDFDEWVQAFEEGKRGQDLPITFDHPKTGGVAAGWVRGLKKGPVREIMGKSRQTFLMKPEWTPQGQKSIDSKDYQYFSLEILPEGILRGGSLVNFPAVKGLHTVAQPVQFAEYYLSEFLAEKQEEEKKVVGQTIKCPECGKNIPEGSENCPLCGAKIEEEVVEEKMSDELKEKLAEFEKLRVRLTELESEKTSLSEQVSELKGAQSDLATLSETVTVQAKSLEEQEQQITSLIELNNALRLHEKVIDFMKLGEDSKIITPAYEEKIIDLLIHLPSTEKEDEVLELLGALAKGDAVVELGERGSGAIPGLLSKSDEGQVALAEKALKLAKEEEISYREALLRMSAAEAGREV